MLNMFLEITDSKQKHFNFRIIKIFNFLTSTNTILNFLSLTSIITQFLILYGGKKNEILV